MADYPKDIIGIKDGDFELGYSSGVMFALTMGTVPGTLLEDPLFGVGQVRLVNAPVSLMTLDKLVRGQLKAEGWQVRNVTWDDTNGIGVDAEPPKV